MLSRQTPARRKRRYFVYILRCADKSLYTGITTDPERRFREHCAGTASRYTRVHKAMQLQVVETMAGRSDALKREAAIKRLRRKDKLALLKTTTLKQRQLAKPH